VIQEEDEEANIYQSEILINENKIESQPMSKNLVESIAVPLEKGDSSNMSKSEGGSSRRSNHFD